MDDVVVLYRIKNEERWLEQSIRSIQRTADRIVVFDDHSADNSKNIALSFDKVVWVDSPFDETTDEVRDKNFLVQKVLKDHRPVWIFCLDGDEELAPGGDIKLRGYLDKLMQSKYTPQMVHFKFLYMWDKPDMVRHDGLYSTFISPRLWKVGYEHDKYVFEYNKAKSGFHCGWVPTHMKEPVPLVSKIPILHWGNFTAEIRRWKYVWYNIKDPNNYIEDRYRHIVSAGRNFKYSGDSISLVPLSKFLC